MVSKETAFVYVHVEFICIIIYEHVNSCCSLSAAKNTTLFFYFLEIFHTLQKYTLKFIENSRKVNVQSLSCTMSQQLTPIRYSFKINVPYVKLAVYIISVLPD